MPSIDSTLLVNLLDRVTAQHQIIRDGLIDANSGLGFYPTIHNDVSLEPNGDADVEGSLVTPANTLDNNFGSGTLLNTIFGTFVRAINSHLQGTNASSLNSYLTAEDVNVHEDFHPVFAQTIGGTMSAVNVFRKSVISMAFLTFSGSGTAVFTQGDDLGAGSGTFDSEANSAAAPLEVFVQSGIVIGANDIQLELTLLEEDGTVRDAAQIVIPSGSVSGTTFSIESGDPFRSVTDGQIAGGNSGDIIGIRNVIERTPSL